MREGEDTDRHAKPLEAQQAVRKPYRKPAVRHEAISKNTSMSQLRTES